MLVDPAQRVRRAAVRVFGNHGRFLPGAESALLEALDTQRKAGAKRDDEMLHALLVACALLPARTATSCTSILPILGDAQRNLRMTAAFALGSIGRRETTAALEESVQLEYEVRHGILEDDLVCRQALLALGRIQPRRALEVLTDHLLYLRRRHTSASEYFSPYFAIFAHIAGACPRPYDDLLERLEALRYAYGEDYLNYLHADLRRARGLRAGEGRLRRLSAADLQTDLADGSFTQDGVERAAELGFRPALQIAAGKSGFRTNPGDMIRHTMTRDRTTALRAGTALARLALGVWEMQYANDFPPREVILATEAVLRGAAPDERDLTGAPPNQWCTPAAFCACRAINILGDIARSREVDPERVDQFGEYLLRALLGGPDEIPVLSGTDERTLLLGVPVFGDGGLRPLTPAEALRRLRKTLYLELTLTALGIYDPATASASEAEEDENLDLDDDEPG